MCRWKSTTFLFQDMSNPGWLLFPVTYLPVSCRPFLSMMQLNRYTIHKGEEILWHYLLICLIWQAPCNYPQDLK